MKFLKFFTKETVREIASPEKVIEQVLGKGIEWYNYEELDYQGQVNYYNKAQEILKNEILQNEINHAVADLIRYIAKQSKDMSEVRDLRMTINGLQLLMDRLEHIKNPKIQESKDNIHDAI